MHLAIKYFLKFHFTFGLCVFVFLGFTTAQVKVPLKNRPSSTAVVKCAENEFKCQNGLQCVHYAKTCDGEINCKDSSDEIYTTCFSRDAPTCILPNQTDDKSYAINCHEGISKYKPSDDRVKQYTTLTYICNPGYTRENENNLFESYCLNRTWTPIKDCKKICKRLFPTDLNLECYRNDEKINCDGPMLAGSKVRATCKPQYKHSGGADNEEIVCNENGQWSNALPDCVLECGKIEGSDSSWMVLANSVNYNHFPWHVAIYNVKNNPTLICSGTIISPTLIITDSSCVRDEKRKNVLNVFELDIVVAKVTPNYHIQDNEFQRNYKVQQIYTGEHNLAVLELFEKIAFSYGVLPACTDLNYYDEMSGKVASWGIIKATNSDHNGFRLDEYVTKNYEECTTEEDKFCGQQTYGAGSNISDVGAGYIHRDSDGLYYIIGVVNMKYKFKNTFAIICTNIHHYTKWLDPITQKVDDQRLTDLIFKTRTECEYESSFNIRQQRASICVKRNKAYTMIPPCKRFCSKLLPKNLNVTCTYNNQPVDCSGDLGEGTVVSFQCLKGYKSKFDQKHTQIVCEQNGKWSDELYECVPGNIKSCPLPPQTKDKHYTIDCDSRRLQPDNHVEELTMLAFQCESGYYYKEISPSAGYECKNGQKYFEKVNNFQVICINGSWTPEIKSCKKLCKALPFLNLKPECYYDGEKIDCKQPLVAGTRMHPLCEKHYRKKYVVDVEEIICNDDGNWDNVPIECIPACGRNVISEFTNDYEEIPFHISIVDKKKNLPICAGTLIMPYLVLTAASCVYNPITKSVGSASNFEVITGKKLKRLSSSLNTDVLKYTNYRKSYKVKNIYLTNKGKTKIIANYTEDLVVLETAEKIELNVNTIPACVNWHQSDEFDVKPYFNISHDAGSAQSGKLAKWDTDYFENDGTYIGSEINLHTFLHYSYDTCKQFTSDIIKTKPDLFCLWATPQSSRLNTSDLGAGYIQVRGDWDLYHVQGVYASKTSNDSYLLMINVNYYANWLKRVNDVVDKQRIVEEMRKNFLMKSYDFENPGCDDVLSNLSFGVESKLSISCDEKVMNRYFTSGCKLPVEQLHNIEYEHTCAPSIFKDYCHGVKENGSVPELTKLSYRCKEGYAVGSNGAFENFLSFCNLKWEPPILQCKRHCKKLKPVNLNVTCTYNGAPVKCDGRLVQNTVVVPKCLPEYVPEYNPGYHEITCLSDGEWSDTLYRCKPICGRPASKNVTAITTLIRGGHNATFGEYPWHVAIYDKERNYALICGGSIISPYVVVSAAHCFFDTLKKIKKPASNYIIAVGKIDSDFKKPDSSVTAFYDVESIIMDNFLGITLRYQYDIAILQIKNRIEFNALVIPICIRHTPVVIPSGQLLHVCGWGIDDTDEYSVTLRAVELPYLSISECIKNAPADIVDYISVDKFCVANINGSIVDQGDSGGGLSLVDKTTMLHYLVGVVSFKAKILPTVAIITDSNQYLYLNWISKHMNEIHRIKQYET